MLGLQVHAHVPLHLGTFNQVWYLLTLQYCEGQECHILQPSVMGNKELLVGGEKDLQQASKASSTKQRQYILIVFDMFLYLYHVIARGISFSPEQ